MGWLDNMILRSKLLLLTAVMLLGIIFLSVKGFIGAAQWIEDVDNVGKKESIQAMATLRLDRERVVIRAQTLSVYQFETSQNPNALLGILEQRQKSWALFEKNMKVYEQLIATENGKKDFADFMDKYKAWRGEYVKIDSTIKKLAETREAAAYSALFAQFKAEVTHMIPISDAMCAALMKLLERREVGIVKVADTAHEEASNFKVTITISSVIIVAIAILLAILIIRSVTMSITKAVTTINDGALQISSASDQVASSSTSLAQGASEQASSVEEVSATLEEATAGVTSNTENARQADILAKQANTAAKDGLAKGEELVESMKEVTESAAKIANIVKTIDQIAFQVNLLALNAAVEAARAGEHGLGFAVVADEVRNLAQRAANSAKETGVVIEEAVTQIKKGSEIANLASNSFREIDDKAKKVSDLIGEVALSSREQAEGLNQLGMAMSQIDQVTQQVAANSEEAAAASEELNAQAAAALEAVAALARIVGIDVNQSGVHQKSPSRPKMELKKEIRHIASKPTPRPQAQKPSKNADEIFPLDESDLKEF
ncbi:MAG: methyl-accepting chemotaxis protein [Campylobacterales bacterium]